MFFALACFLPWSNCTRDAASSSQASSSPLSPAITKAICVLVSQRCTTSHTTLRPHNLCICVCVSLFHRVWMWMWMLMLNFFLVKILHTNTDTNRHRSSFLSTRILNLNLSLWPSSSFWQVAVYTFYAGCSVRPHVSVCVYVCVR